LLIIVAAMFLLAYTRDFTQTTNAHHKGQLCLDASSTRITILPRPKQSSSNQ